MILPRRLMMLADGSFCEEDDPKQAMNYRPKGFIVSDAEAERIGLKAYLDRTGWGEKAGAVAEPEAVEAKAVAQAETEDKAVVVEETDNKAEEKPEPEPGLHIDRGSRRRGP